MGNLNKVKIFFFATLRECVGVRSLEMELPLRINVADFKTILIEKFPVLHGLTGHMLISVNQQYAFEDFIIPESAEIALFPPVSGG